MTSSGQTWDTALSEFGAACAAKLSGPGEREAAIRTPLALLVERLGVECGRPTVLHDEVRDEERRVRPDYGVSVNGVVMGYIEVKAPGGTIDPARMTGHDLNQWERQKDLPNLMYTNGTQWRLYKDGVFVNETTLTDLPLASAGSDLHSNQTFELIIRTFLDWKAAAITSVGALVRAIAPLTRVLRGEVIDQLAAERRKVRAGSSEDEQPFIGLAKDWRRLLFPQADDKTFADGYAQAVTFALLLARTSDISLEGRSLHDVGKALGVQHSLMGRALQLLTDYVAADFKVSLDLLVTVIGAVHWDRIRNSRRDVYLYLYEEFLAEYDDELRQASGTYYTPQEIVNEMVRLTQEVLTDDLQIQGGFASPDVFTIDPAMGTGTYLQSVIETVRTHTEDELGEGAVSGALTELAKRIAGFEIQMGPYAVAELRVAELLGDAGATLPADGLKLYVTDTLDDPTADQTQIASGLQTIARSRERANAIKRNQKVNVVIGNPPYRELAAGLGGWVERGSAAHKGNSRAILDDFVTGVPGKLTQKIKNFYVFFWRWATWKVWESTPSDETGVICFITTSGYLKGTAFTSMRRYLREHASDGWIIDLTPEGQTPDIPTRVFPGVRQPLAIGIFVRKPGTSSTQPADLRYISVHGRRAEKFKALRGLHPSSPQWRPVRTGWTAPLTAAPESAWDQWPAPDDLMPWYSPGVFPTRTWVYSPSPATLEGRWQTLVAEPSSEKRRVLMKDSGGYMEKQFKHIPGHEHQNRLRPIAELGPGTSNEAIVTVGFRAFDRHKLIADPRLIHRHREGLWAAIRPGQVYVIEQHSVSIDDGPGLLFSVDIPDFHHFNNRGGRALPLLHPDGSPNLAPGLESALSAVVGTKVSSPDVIAYLAAVTAHPAFTQTFAVELETPGIRIPITTDPALWSRATSLGQEIIWAQSYGGAFGEGRASGKVTFAKDDPKRVTCTKAVQQLPNGIEYLPETQEIQLGGGRFGPIPRDVFDYEVGGRNVLKSWVAYRSENPAGKRTSPLDDINPTAWEHTWTQDLVEVLSVLTRLVDLEPKQDALLTEILQQPLVTKDELTAAGVSWPANDADRKPRYRSEVLF